MPAYLFAVLYWKTDTKLRWHVYKLDVSLLSFRWFTVRSTIRGNDMDNVTIVN